MQVVRWLGFLGRCKLTGGCCSKPASFRQCPHVLSRRYTNTTPPSSAKAKATPTPTPKTPGSSRQQAKRDKRKLWLLVIPVTTFCLGTWQIFRLQWKLDLIDQLESKTRRPPQPLTADILEHLDELEYSRVSLSGYYDHSRELHMWPRTLNTADTSSRRNTEPGACVVTPFYCHQLKEWVLVNRGWVPRRKMEPSTRPKGQIEGDVSLVAVVRTQEKRPHFSPHNDPAHNHWSYKDVALMAQHTDTTPLFLDADASSTVLGGPIGGQTRVSLRNDHLQYIFTWYALSLFTGYMFYTLWTKSKRRKMI